MGAYEDRVRTEAFFKLGCLRLYHSHAVAEELLVGVGRVIRCAHKVTVVGRVIRCAHKVTVVVIVLNEWVVTKLLTELDCEHGGRGALHEDGKHLVKLGLSPSVNKKDSISFEGLLCPAFKW